MRTLELEIVNENMFILSKDKSVESLGYSVTVQKGIWLWILLEINKRYIR